MDMTEVGVDGLCPVASIARYHGAAGAGCGRYCMLACMLACGGYPPPPQFLTTKRNSRGPVSTSFSRYI
eukprot:3318950-Prymnesium_polylepis.2